ncbi:MAG TPA: IS1595 family transposase [Pyrinomonadaceae bacterium]|nr:IS1595 family transposase [Pyrinomonadaceae bacterium]
METDKPLPKTLLEAVKYFEDIDRCIEFMSILRWPDGVICPHCDSEQVGFLKTRRIWKCKAKECRKQFSIKSGTVLEDSPIGLDKWLSAIWMIVNNKNGKSSYEMASDLGITQKSAWFLNHRIRLAMQSGTFNKLSGQVEVDETWIGGKARNMHGSALARRVAKFATPHTGRNQNIGKVAVMGLLERHGEVRTMVVEGTKRRMLHGEVVRHVEAGSTVYTDALRSYNRLDEEYIHNVINHAERYVDGHIHTNGIENFWSLLKRSIGGMYVSVEPFHLFRYLDEQSFRFNKRKVTALDRFIEATKTVTGRRLTFKELTGKDINN